LEEVSDLEFDLKSIFQSHLLGHIYQIDIVTYIKSNFLNKTSHFLLHILVAYLKSFSKHFNLKYFFIKYFSNYKIWKLVPPALALPKMSDRWLKFLKYCSKTLITSIGMASGWMPRIDSALCRRFANVAVCIIRAGSSDSDIDLTLITFVNLNAYS